MTWRVLVVEDEVDSRDMMAALLESEGYETVTAENGRDALAKLRDIRVDLIVTDVMMPFMSGEELVAELKADAWLRSIPVIVMSAGDGSHVASRFQCQFCAKPVEIGAFLRLMRRLVAS
jgi:CheY-like chemotaxis protein